MSVYGPWVKGVWRWVSVNVWGPGVKGFRGWVSVSIGAMGERVEG